jgi:hypothetical protein
MEAHSGEVRAFKRRKREIRTVQIRRRKVRTSEVTVIEIRSHQPRLGKARMPKVGPGDRSIGEIDTIAISPMITTTDDSEGCLYVRSRLVRLTGPPLTWWWPLLPRVLPDECSQDFHHCRMIAGRLLGYPL